MDQLAKRSKWSQLFRSIGYESGMSKMRVFAERAVLAIFSICSAEEEREKRTQRMIAHGFCPEALLLGSLSGRHNLCNDGTYHTRVMLAGSSFQSVRALE
jgi:hypothetical protein